MAPLDRTEKFQIRLTADEKRMLEAVADEEGLSASDLFRQFVRQRFAALFPALGRVEAEVAKQKALTQLVVPQPARIELDSLKKGEAASRALKSLARSPKRKKK